MGENFLAEVLGTGIADPSRRRGRRRRSAHALQGPELRLDRHHHGVGIRRVLRRDRGRAGQRCPPQPRGHPRGGDERRHPLGRGPVYWAGEMLGAFIGAVLVFLHYYPHWAETEDADLKLAVFSTGPAIRSPLWNFVSEAIGTFVLVFVIFAFANNGECRAGRARRPAGGAARVWSSAWPSAGPRAMRSTRPATSGRGSPTSCCRSPASATRTGDMPGSRSSRHWWVRQ